MRINGEVVRWARERLQASALEASALSGFAPGQIESWESGDVQPTFNQALHLAHKLRIPFGYLFLSRKPERSLSLPDLRTITGQQARTPSLDLIAVVDDALRKQHWYSELLREQGRSPLEFVGKFSLKDPVLRVAADIRNVIGIDEQMRAESAPTVSSFLTELVRRSEHEGVLVLRSGTVCGNTHTGLNVREFRGFALPDEYAPLIFINSKDALVAQIFTWAHEIAHIWIGAPGVSLVDFTRRSSEQANQIEIRCNEIAAEVLVPAAGFSHNWSKILPLDSNIEILRKRYRVSGLVVLRRAYDTALIGDAEFREGLRKYYDIPLEAKLKKDDEAPSGGNFYNSLYARNSSLLTASVAENYGAGNILASDACGLLGVGRKVLSKLVAAT